MQLRAMGHTEIIWATNGREALALLKEEATDLIISAWSMPEMDGPALLTACKQDPGLKHIPFILLGDMYEQTATAMKAGADAYLVRPFFPEELQEVLRKVASSGQ